MKNIYVIWAHPRQNSLTARIVLAIREELVQNKAKVTELDLYRSGFDPALQTVDEPDWNDVDKVYSDEGDASN